jgi:hypothetical protein
MVKAVIIPNGQEMKVLLTKGWQEAIWVIDFPGMT